MEEFVQNSLFHAWCEFVETSYDLLPQMEYSACTLQKGWNVKCRKALCTLYPLEGYFIALVVVGGERPEAEIESTTCTAYIQALYNGIQPYCGSRRLMIEVTDEQRLADVKSSFKFAENQKIRGVLWKLFH